MYIALFSYRSFLVSELLVDRCGRASVFRQTWKTPNQNTGKTKDESQARVAQPRTKKVPYVKNLAKKGAAVSSVTEEMVPQKASRAQRSQKSGLLTKKMP